MWLTLPGRRTALAIAGEAGGNFLLPWLVYTLVASHHGQVVALLASSIPPVLWSLGEFLRYRRIDAISLLVLGGIVLSLLAFIGGGGVKLLQLRENLVNGLVGLLFLVSTAVGRPLLHEIARAALRRQSAAKASEVERLATRPGFRRRMRIMTLVWGLGLLAQTGLASALVFILPIGSYLLVSPVLGYAVTGALLLWTVLYARAGQRGSAP